MRELSTKIITKTNPAFNLPVDTIYYAYGSDNKDLNEVMENFVRISQEEFCRDGILDYKFENISQVNWQDTKVHELLSLRFPEKTPAEIDELQKSVKSGTNGNDQVFSGLSPIKELFDDSVTGDCFATFVCRLLPQNGENDTYRFLTMNLRGTNGDRFRRLRTFFYRLNFENKASLGFGYMFERECYSQSRRQFSTPKEIDEKTCFDIGDSFKEFEKKCSKEPDIERSKKQDIESCCEYSSDLNENDSLREKAEKIRDEIAALQRENGINILIETLGTDLLSTLKQLQPPILSSIVIDEELNIHLPEYQGKEIKMNALSKTLYILFLLHPEGIRIKDISNNYGELLAIYKLISNRENVESLGKSIDELCDPLSNSINEKLSRIRKAFCDIMISDLAQEYIPEGPRGEARRINLDRELIVLPQVLKTITK